MKIPYICYKSSKFKEYRVEKIQHKGCQGVETDGKK